MGWDGADWNQEGETGDRVECGGRGKSWRRLAWEMKEEAATTAFRIWERT